MWFTVKHHTIDFTIDVNYTNLVDALEITVKNIMKNYKPPYRLMVTGGVDSQTVLLAWKWFGKDYIPTSVRYNLNLNHHDLETLSLFSSRENLDIEYIDFDLLEFYQSKYFELADIYKITSPHFGAHLGMTENLDGTIIFSGDRLTGVRAVIGYNNICLYNASLIRPIVPYFLLHTPEVAYSKIFRISQNLSESFLNLSEYDKKVRTLQLENMPVIPQLTKYTGFERVKEFYDQYINNVPIKTKLQYSHKPSKRAYDLLLRYPLEKKYGSTNFKFKLNKLI